MRVTVLAAVLAVAACDRSLQETDFKASNAAVAAARSTEFRVCKFGLDLDDSHDQSRLVQCMESKGYTYAPR